MRIIFRLALLVLAATMFGREARAETAQRPYLDLPITQRVMRSGSIRYGVWVKVGERSVEAMLDTGSTGLRVLPSVFRGEMTGSPTDVAFGAGMHMAGVIVKMPVEIGSLAGTAEVEVIKSIGCVDTTKPCGVPIPSVDSYLIGGDGYPSDGYSAILGIGLPFAKPDIGNPLAALGVKRWIVELPLPDAIGEGHLILDPDDKTRAGFTLLARHGAADADGCIEGGTPSHRECGTLLFDTGAPGMEVSADDITTAVAWDDGTPGTLTFKVPKADSLTLDFKTGESGGVRSVLVKPQTDRDAPEPFILAGVQPYFTYSLLYDEPDHTVGLAKRPSAAAASGEPPTPIKGKSARNGTRSQRIAQDRGSKSLDRAGAAGLE